MSCSQSNVTFQMVRKGFIKPNLQIRSKSVSKDLYDYLNAIDQLAKKKYGVEGPLFSIQEKLDYETPLGDKVKLLFLVPNQPAFVAIDNSKQMQFNEIEASKQVYKDWENIKTSGNFEEVEGEIVVPNLPKLKIKCK